MKKGAWAGAQQPGPAAPERGWKRKGAQGSHRRLAPDHRFQISCRAKFVEVLEEKFADLNLTFSIGGQISFDVFPQVRLQACEAKGEGGGQVSLPRPMAAACMPRHSNRARAAGRVLLHALLGGSGCTRGWEGPAARAGPPLLPPTPLPIPPPKRQP